MKKAEPEVLAVLSTKEEGRIFLFTMGKGIPKFIPVLIDRVGKLFSVLGGLLRICLSQRTCS